MRAPEQLVSPSSLFEMSEIRPPLSSPTFCSNSFFSPPPPSRVLILGAAPPPKKRSDESLSHRGDEEQM